MPAIAHLAATIFRHAKGRGRFLVAVAGAPGAGKSTNAGRLIELLREAPAALVPMDGFHFDNDLLAARGLLERKGAPETFDFSGLHSLLLRLREARNDIAVPVFDRTADLARAGAAIIHQTDRIVIVEGNYLLLNEAPWDMLAPLFDMKVFLDVPRGELAHRLVQRWIAHGMTPEAARERAFANDMPNAERIINAVIEPDVTIKFER